MTIQRMQHRGPQIVAREVQGGFEIAMILFVPFVLFGAAMMLLTGAKQAARKARNIAAPVVVFALLLYWAVRPLERGR